MSVQSTRAAVQKYLDSNHEDLSVMADDVVFTDMNSGQEHRGPDAVRGMLHYIYHVAFDAHAENANVVVDEGRAVLEAWFIGTHTGEFAGIPATGRSVRVPLCVVYDVKDDRISRGRVYMAVGAMMQQLNAANG
ncbi:MAG TPA: ester cyclase [Gemmatimonadaceae bacterium]|nr:ester cyclase [Gemmatimonadaceae bacterium]